MGSAAVTHVRRVRPKAREGGLRVPWEHLLELSAAGRRAIEEEALRLNDRYLIDVIERYAFCPFAKEGRAAGQTSRSVLIADSPSVEPFLRTMREVAASGVAVAQVILPLADVDPVQFSRFCIDLTAEGHARMGGDSVLALAPLHPELSFGETALAMVPLFRRAPDPTIQWVRLDALESIYAGRSSDDRYVSSDNVLEYLEKHPKGEPSLYDRIAETNAVMARRLGISHVVDLLSEIAAEGRERYARILLAEGE